MACASSFSRRSTSAWLPAAFSLCQLRLQVGNAVLERRAEVGLVSTDARAVAEPFGELDHGPRALAMILEPAIAAPWGPGPGVPDLAHELVPTVLGRSVWTVTAAVTIPLLLAVSFPLTTATAVLATLSIAMAVTIPATAAVPTVVLGQRGLPGNSRMAAVDGRRHGDQW